MTETNPNILIQISKSDLQQLIQEAIKNEMNKISKVIEMNPKQSENQNDLLTRYETASLLGVSTTTLFLWNRDGILNGKKINRRVYYSKREVYAKLDFNEVA
jgi:hypothetical protein